MLGLCSKLFLSAESVPIRFWFFCWRITWPRSNDWQKRLICLGMSKEWMQRIHILENDLKNAAPFGSFMLVGVWKCHIIMISSFGWRISVWCALKVVVDADPKDDKVKLWILIAFVRAVYLCFAGASTAFLFQSYAHYSTHTIITLVWSLHRRAGEV